MRHPTSASIRRLIESRSRLALANYIWQPGAMLWNRSDRACAWLLIPGLIGLVSTSCANDDATRMTEPPVESEDGTGGMGGDAPSEEADSGAECEASSEEMVCVPAGSFSMGCNQSLADGCQAFEFPFHEVYVDAFAIDRYEVTVAGYRACVEEGSCTMPAECDGGAADSDEQPVRCVDWQQASDYCAWAGKRLLTEAEWERAARGDDSRFYPWGNEPPTCEQAVFEEEGGGPGCDQDKPLPVGSRPSGNSPYDVFDMAGNIEEWVMDWFNSESYAEADRRNPTGPEEGTSRIVRGGSYLSTAVSLRASSRWAYPPDSQLSRLGIRCGRSLP